MLLNLERAKKLCYLELGMLGRREVGQLAQRHVIKCAIALGPYLDVCLQKPVPFASLHGPVI